MNLKKIIKEEIDDLQWIKDINPEIERFNVGEIIRVHNVGDEEAFLDFLGVWKDEYLRGDFGPNITGRVSLENHLGTFGLMVKGRDGDMAEIYFPYPRLIKRYQDNGYYPGLGIGYEVLPKESITESEDVFKWMKDVQEVLPKNEDWILVNDVDIYDIEEGKKIQKYIFNHDIPWATGDKRVMSLPIHTIHHKNQQKAFRKGFTYRTTDSIERTKEIIEQWEKAGLLVLYWSQIKPKEITESDDLQWIRDVKTNPWDGKEFKIDTGPFGTSTTYKILDWGDSRGVRVVWRKNDDWRNRWRHTHYTREEVEKYVNNGTWVIVNENITESEDDLEWIRDINPINHDYLKGKAIYFNPPIDNQEDLDRILDYLESVDFDFGSWYRNYDWENDVVEGLYLTPHDYVIYSSNLFGEDYEEHISNYAGRPVEVLDGWSIF